MEEGRAYLLSDTGARPIDAVARTNGEVVRNEALERLQSSRFESKGNQVAMKILANAFIATCVVKSAGHRDPM